MDKKEWKKLSELNRFTTKKFVKKYYQKWNEATGKYERSDTPAKGFSARYAFEMQDCMVNLSSDNVGQMLVGLFDSGLISIEDYTFDVRNNGKSGKDIRYFINIVKNEPAQAKPQASDEDELAMMGW